MLIVYLHLPQIAQTCLRYLAYQEDKDGFYTTPQLPDFGLHVPTLWVMPLPDPLVVVDAVKAMLAEK